MGKLNLRDHVDPQPPLNALRTFEVAARRGGFAAAARELGVTPAAVSLQVRNLELVDPRSHLSKNGCTALRAHRARGIQAS